MKDFFISIKTFFSGIAFAIITGIAGFLILPEALSNMWRCVIFVTLVLCYALGYVFGRKQAIKELEQKIEGKQAAIDEEKRKNAKLAAILDDRKRREHEQVQRNEDADRLLKISFPEYKVIDGILTTESNGRQYRHKYNEAIGHLYSEGVIVDLHDGRTYVINMNLRPFFEKYEDAVHKIANGTNDDRKRIVESVRDGTYKQGFPS